MKYLMGHCYLSVKNKIFLKMVFSEGYYQNKPLAFHECMIYHMLLLIWNWQAKCVQIEVSFSDKVCKLLNEWELPNDYQSREKPLN